jgi:hypothetical protein
MSAESSLTAVAVVRALLDEDTEGLARHTVHARACLPSGLRSSKGAPAAVDNFPGHACGMITMAATT